MTFLTLAPQIFICWLPIFHDDVTFIGCGIFIADKIAFAKISAVVANGWITNEIFIAFHDEVLSVALYLAPFHFVGTIFVTTTATQMDVRATTVFVSENPAEECIDFVFHKVVPPISNEFLIRAVWNQEGIRF